VHYSNTHWNYKSNFEEEQGRWAKIQFVARFHYKEDESRDPSENRSRKASFTTVTAFTGAIKQQSYFCISRKENDCKELPYIFI